MSVDALKEAWKDFSLDGADVLFSCSPGRASEDDDWPDELAWGVGWKGWHGGRKYGSFVMLSAPVFNEVVADHLRQTYAEFSRLHPV